MTIPDSPRSGCRLSSFPRIIRQPNPTHPNNSAPMVMGRKAVAGSVIGGLAETQEMLDFCGQYDITSDIEVIKMQDINESFERMLRSDVKYRFVIDMATLPAA